MKISSIKARQINYRLEALYVWAIG